MCAGGEYVTKAWIFPLRTLKSKTRIESGDVVAHINIVLCFLSLILTD